MNFQPQDVTVGTPAVTKSPLRRQRIVLAVIGGVIVLAVAGFLLVEYFGVFAAKDPAPILCTDPCELPHFSRLTGRSV